MAKSIDPNDLHQVHGIDELRRQLLGNFEDPPTIVEPPPPAPSDDEGVSTLDALLNRFALILPDGKVWDAYQKEILKVAAVKLLMGKELYTQWSASERKREVRAEDVRREAAASAVQGGGGLSDALARYVYLYPTDTVWDRERRDRVPISALRFAIADCFDQWMKSHLRQDIDVGNLVFDPSQQADPDTTINTFRGLPLRVHRRDDRCKAILELVEHLCNDDGEIIDWLLKWLAYPLQHVGAKLASAVLMHSHIQGSGKSLLFEEVVKPMYGEYGSTLGQHQLESQYTDWRSQLLFGLFEEVFSRDQKYSHTGTLKQMVTGKTQRIEKKFVSSWEEANHMNGVFLSNELQPFPIEPTDRRWLVIWPRKKMPPDLKARVLADLADGGMEAFYSFLMGYPLRGFGTHTEPPVTAAKERIIEFGLPAWDVFFREWRDGYLGVPFMPCLSEDLFAVYRKWCDKRREHVVSMTRFGGFIGVQEGMLRRRDVHYSVGHGSRKGTFFVPLQPPDEYSPRGDERQGDYLGRCVAEFQRLMDTSDG